MTRIGKTFLSLRQKGRSALIPYITPEFPVRGVTVPLILSLEDSGADFIELGIPFSDPIADGPTIQNSSRIALKNGVTLKKVLSFVTDIRRQSTIPIILMGYFNSFLHYKLTRFFDDALRVGADGIIVPDLPPEEAGSMMKSARSNRLSVTFLIAPTSPPKRIEKIDRLSTDFSYCVSVTGVTGAREQLGENQELESFLRRVKRHTKKPFVVGFGISRRDQVLDVCRYADGAVVGSALIRSMENCKSVSNAVRMGTKFFGSLRP